MPRIRIETGIDAFPPEDWNRCFPGEAEDWAFYRACEEAGPPGFSWFYAAAYEDDRLVAVVPGFTTEYRLDTTLQGGWKRVTEALHRIMPKLLSLRLIALGSPVAEICHLGFAPEIPYAGRARLAGTLVEVARAFGLAHGYSLFGVKDAAARDEAIWGGIMENAGFTRLPGLPTASLDLPYRSFDAYLAGLSRSTRKDMRRKMKAFESVTVEQRHAVDDIEDEIAALYEQTVAHSDLQFEHLPAAYFSAVLRQTAPRSSIFLYRAEGRIIAFNLVIETDEVLIDKYIGMNYDVVRRYNLYFNTWMANVRHCIERGIPAYQSGQAFYGPKVRLGCTLRPNWQYFRHANGLINGVLRWVARFVRLDRFDPAIAGLVEGRAT